MSIDQKIKDAKNALTLKTQKIGLERVCVYMDSFKQINESILIPIYSIGLNDDGDICGGCTDIIEITREDICNVLL